MTTANANAIDYRADVYVTAKGTPMIRECDRRPRRMTAAAFAAYVDAVRDAAADAATAARAIVDRMPAANAVDIADAAAAARDAAQFADAAAAVIAAANVTDAAVIAAAVRNAAADAADAANAAATAATDATPAATATDAAAYAAIADAARDAATDATDAADAADAAADAMTAARNAADVAGETADADAAAYAADAMTAAADAATAAATTPRGHDRRTIRAAIADAAAAHAGETVKRRAAHEMAALFEMGMCDHTDAAAAADAAAVEEFWFVLHSMGVDRMTDANATKSARRGRFYVELTRAGNTLARFDIPASFTEFWADRLFSVDSPEMGGDIAYIPATDADVKRAAYGRGQVYAARGIDCDRTLTMFKANKSGRAIPRKIRMQQYFNNSVKPRINGAIRAAIDCGVMQRGRNLTYATMLRRDHEER